MSFRDRLQDVADRVRDDEEEAETKREAAKARRERAKRRAKKAAKGAKERIEEAGADPQTSQNKSRTKRMFARAEQAGRASAPVDATIDPIGSAQPIEDFATAGNGGTPTSEDRESEMAAGMEGLVLGIGPAAMGEPSDEEGDDDDSEPLEFEDRFGTAAGFGGEN